MTDKITILGAALDIAAKEIENGMTLYARDGTTITKEVSAAIRALRSDAIDAYRALVQERDTLKAERDSLREEVDRLKAPPVRYCVKCGAPETHHPYRHPFVAHDALTKK